jgi:transposase InsO family protein
MKEIRNIYEENKGIYGSPRVHQVLVRRGYNCSVNKVGRLMKKMGLVGRARKAYRILPKLHKFFNKTDNKRLNSSLPDAINQVWVGDLTYLKIGKKWQYLAVVMDLYSRKVVGWSLSDRRTVKLTMNVLNRAIARRKPDDGLIFHSDRGIEYSAFKYQDKLKEHGIIPSMNRPGHCQDNAHMESFFHSLKAELIKGTQIDSVGELRSRLKNYINHFYNKSRLHSALDYYSPVEYEQLRT